MDGNRPSARWVVIVGLGIAAIPLFLGCSHDESEAGGGRAEAPAAEPSEGPAAKSPAEERSGDEETSTKDTPPGPRVRTDSFDLRATAQRQYAAGKLASFGVTLTGRGKWHINKKFPFAIRLDAPEEIELPKHELSKGDAAEFREARAHVDVPFTPAKQGAHRVEANVEFAVCTPETCVPHEQKLGVELNVGNSS